MVRGNFKCYLEKSPPPRFFCSMCLYSVDTERPAGRDGSLGTNREPFLEVTSADV